MQNVALIQAMAMAVVMHQFGEEVEDVATLPQ
jgi:hypothetical protein